MQEIVPLRFGTVNCFGIIEDGSAILVDTGPEPIRERLLARISGWNIRLIALTHGHFDHIMGIDGFLQEFFVPVYACVEERQLLENAQYNASIMYGEGYTFAGAVYVADGQILNVAGMKIRVIHTPGHTIGGCCYYLEDEQVLFSGDTLFQESIGRADLPTGNASALVRSVREKLLVLPETVRVYPGHEEMTTIEMERKYNPFI